VSSPATDSAKSAEATRRHRVADAAIAVLGSEGARALTHRRVDRESELPVGSTSNVFRTREELLLGALDRLIELEIGDTLAPQVDEQDPLGSGAALLAALIEEWTRPEHRARLQARFELLLEATRRPDFGPPLLERRSQIIRAVEQLIQTEGHANAHERAVSIVAWVDGILLHHLLDGHLMADHDQLIELVHARLMA
jgi:DNA-binding transcriptional regulator YbjK